jgi:cathepsin B
VTGGDYLAKEDGSSCFPYQLPNCDHHEGGPYPTCPSICGASECATPKCASACEANYPKKWAADKHHASTAYSVSSSVAQIQAELMTYGSVTAAFTVYADLLTYKSGVYSHVSGAELGGHAVKIVGWGTTADGVDYWDVANSTWTNSTVNPALGTQPLEP